MTDSVPVSTPPSDQIQSLIKKSEEKVSEKGAVKKQYEYTPARQESQKKAVAALKAKKEMEEHMKSEFEALRKRLENYPLKKEEKEKKDETSSSSSAEAIPIVPVSKPIQTCEKEEEFDSLKRKRKSMSKSSKRKAKASSSSSSSSESDSDSEEEEDSSSEEEERKPSSKKRKNSYGKKRKEVRYIDSDDSEEEERNRRMPSKIKKALKKEVQPPYFKMRIQGQHSGCIFD